MLGLKIFKMGFKATLKSTPNLRGAYCYYYYIIIAGSSLGIAGCTPQAAQYGMVLHCCDGMFSNASFQMDR
jgi:hypothetical protein